MKRPLAIALSVALCGGAAFAQGLPASIAPAPTPAFTIPSLDDNVRSGAAAASREVHRACAADMHALCHGKAGLAADRCLVYHRLNFSPGCRRAITGFEAAAAPIGRDETLVDFQPYSRVQIRSRAPVHGWRPIPAAPAPAASGD